MTVDKLSYAVFCPQPIRLLMNGLAKEAVEYEDEMKNRIQTVEIQRCFRYLSEVNTFNSAVKNGTLSKAKIKILQLGCYVFIFTV